MLATFLLAIAAQDQPATMTLETSVLNAPAIVQLVADASKRKLAASPEMANNVLLIKVKDADAQGVIDRIAKVTLGKWMDREGVLTLMPDAAARKKAIDTQNAEKLERMEKSLGYWENPRGEAEGEDFGEMTKEEIAELMKMRQEELAQQKAVAQLIRNVGLRRIAAMEPGERVVYSDRPNAAQVRLNGPWNQMYASMKMRFDRGDFSYDGDMGDFEEGMPPDMAEFMAIQRAMAEQTKPFDGVPVKFLLAIQRPSNGGYYGYSGSDTANAQLFALDKNGSAAYVTSMSFDGGMAAEDMMGIGVPPAEAGGEEVQTPPEPQGRPIKFTPEELELGLGMYGSAMPEATAVKLQASYTDLSKDPLDIVGGTILRRVAEAGDLDVVANLPDSVALSRYMLSKDYQQHVTIEFIEENLTSNGGALCEEKDGWLEVSPANFDQHVATRMDRPTLAAYAASLAQGQGMKLDMVAEFMYQNPYSASNGLFQVLKEMSPSANSWMGNDNVPIMRFWGSLTPGHRQALRSKQPLSIGSLSKASRDLLSWYVYSTELQLQPPPPAAFDKYSLPARTMVGMMMFGGFGGGGMRSWLSEPTESLPQGLPANGRITVDLWSEICFVPAASAMNPMIPGVLGATEMVMLDAFRAASPNEASEILNSLPTRATVGRRTNMALTMAFSPQVQAVGHLSDVELSADRRMVNLISPPADIKASIDETRKEMAVLESFMKYMVGSMGQGEGGQRPPP